MWRLLQPSAQVSGSTCVCVCVCVCVPPLSLSHTLTHMHTCTHTLTLTHSHSHTHTHTHSLSLSLSLSLSVVCQSVQLYLKPDVKIDDAFLVLPLLAAQVINLLLWPGLSEAHTRQLGYAHARTHNTCTHAPPPATVQRHQYTSSML